MRKFALWDILHGRFLRGQDNRNQGPGDIGDVDDRPPTVAIVPEVVKGTTVLYEEILATEPDLILYDTMIYSDDEIAKIEELGIETLAYNPNTIEEYADFGYRLASMINTEMYMNSYIDKVYQSGNVRVQVTRGPRGGQASGRLINAKQDNFDKISCSGVR